MFYGISANSAALKALRCCLIPQYYNLLPLGGICQSVRQGMRQTDIGFYGVGCPHPEVDCLVKQISLLLMHYGCNTAVGKMMRISMELFIVELGMEAQPFQVDFSRYGDLVSASWLKSIWEKVHQLGIIIVESLANVVILRENDRWIMEALAGNRHTPSSG